MTAKKPDHVKLEEAHVKAGKATAKKFGPDWYGQEATAFYNKVLQGVLKSEKET